MKANRTLWAALMLCAALLLMAFAGALVRTPVPVAHDLVHALEGPSATHWLGCDAFGADLAAEIFAGALHSLIIATIVTVANLSLGLLIGTLAAVAPAGAAVLFTRLIDCFLAFPGILLAIFLASIMPRSSQTALIALALTGWATRARFCRTAVKQLLGTLYIEAAVASGASRSRIVLRHLWPAVAGQLLVQGALSAGYVIIAEASLSFLGLGGTTDNFSWGRLIADGRDYLVEAPHLSIFPGVAFVFAVIAFNLLAEGLRQALEPSQRSL